MRRNYADIALHVPTLLLPKADIPLETWAVIACDQHTSNAAYWDQTRRIVGDRPSTLDLVLPEAHLRSGGVDAAAQAIHGRMRRYADALLAPQPPGFMLAERHTGRAAPRRGLVAALDLARYDYRSGAGDLIRCTEGTDPGRLPARIAVRRGAALDVPHVLVLIDDPGCTVIEPLMDAHLPSAYDVELMQGGGRLRGWHVSDPARIDSVARAIAALRQGDPPLFYAVGDGNHSLAAARAVWEEIGRTAGSDHPARHALVELVNIHDPGLEFAPIHRLVEGIEPPALLAAMQRHFADAGPSSRTFADRAAWRRAAAEAIPGHRFPYATDGECGIVDIAHPPARLAAATLHGFLDPLLAAHPGSAIDYIHGDDALLSLAAQPGRIGFLLPAMDKRDLFRTVIEDGATPRKTFSLGEAHEKRYYMECRHLQP